MKHAIIGLLAGILAMLAIGVSTIKGNMDRKEHRQGEAIWSDRVVGGRQPADVWPSTWKGGLAAIDLAVTFTFKADAINHIDFDTAMSEVLEASNAAF